MLYQNEGILKIQNADEIVIYGAGMMGKMLRKCLEGKPYYMHIISYMVESLQDNPEMIDDVPVTDLAHAGLYKNSLILVALHEKYITKAIKNLKTNGFSNIMPVTFDSDLWSDIRGNWFYQRQIDQNIDYLDLEESFGENNIHVYIVKSVWDRQLNEKIPIRKFEIPIQAGAALTNQRIAFVNDVTGENISEKNQQYSELTVLYWIWKHDRAKYVGLCHYRRRFQMSEREADKLVRSDIDVVLTVPILNFPNVKSQYAKDHDSADWNIMMQAVSELTPEYAKAADAVQNGIYYYAYNMILARREVINEYCGWLFPILFYCEEKIGQKEDNYQNRYIGFLAERLLTVFFIHNQDRYKIAIAKKHFIEPDYAVMEK